MDLKSAYQMRRKLKVNRLKRERIRGISCTRFLSEVLETFYIDYSFSLLYSVDCLRFLHLTTAFILSIHLPWPFPTASSQSKHSSKNFPLITEKRPLMSPGSLWNFAKNICDTGSNPIIHDYRQLTNQQVKPLPTWMPFPDPCSRRWKVARPVHASHLNAEQ